MKAKSRSNGMLAGLALVAIAVTDAGIAALLGIDPLLPSLARDGAAGGLLVFALGHCDGLDGPVVTLARRALEEGNVNLVLPWVRKQDEAEIRSAFEHASAVRKLGEPARQLADHHFFETLVRVHRASEGAPYTGLKPAGRDLGPAVPAADRALEDGSVDKVVALLAEAVKRGVHEHFHAAQRRRKFDADDVPAGRRYVEAYVPYVHYIERLWRDAAGAAHGHHAGHAEHAAHGH